MFYTSDGN